LTKKITCCILAAGFGSRMGKVGENLNKSLISINQKSAITRIIENFPKKTNFVIATGYKDDQVKKFLKISHPKSDIKFVKVKDYSSPLSGPGLSLLKCRSYLRKPFFFVSCDTLFKKKIIKPNIKYNFLGVGFKNSGFKDYCNFEVNSKKIINIYDKIKPKKRFFNFSGFGFIYDHKKFWDFKSLYPKRKGFEISTLLKPFIKKSNVRILKMFWEDIGTEQKLSMVKKKYEKFDFSKPDEQIYIENRKVIKFHSSFEMQKKKYKKSLLNKSVFPKCYYKKNFLFYNFQKGFNLYDKNNSIIFKNYLKWLNKNLWIRKKVPKKEFYESCLNFYKNKTFNRLNLFLENKGNKDLYFHINSQNYPHINEIIKNIDFNKICNTANSTFIHGDLHFDNTIYDIRNKKFKLIDWRSDFSGKLDYGDQYYDLAKLYGGLLMDYSKIKKNDFEFKKINGNIKFKFKKTKNYNKYIKIYEKFLILNNFDINKIKIIVGLIYLNMAPLHQKPFDELLFCLSKEFLSKGIKKYK